MSEAAVRFDVLVIDDEELYAQAIARELGRVGVGCELAFCARDALRRSEQTGRYQAILLDHHLPDDDGLKLVPLLLARLPGAALIMITAFQTIPNAVEAIRLGAYDYVVKEPSVQPLVDRVLELRRREAVRQAADGWQEHQRAGLLGQSPPMVKVVEQLSRIVRSPETTVLLTGETGVGKEVACRCIHQSSQPESPLVAVDCLALPETLAESLLFGHERGAFTGAEQTRTGAFEEARDGTVFLDEIGDLSAPLQGKLLRVLESRVFHRLGSNKEIPLRARVVAATNRDLGALVEQGTFRLDLFQRLAVFPILIPPLRMRGNDVLLLAEHFRSFFAGKLRKQLEPLGGAVVEKLVAYDYPGNVRELKNIIERAVICTDSNRIEVHHLPERLLETRRAAEPAAPSFPFDFVPGIDTLGTLERRMIQQALRRAGGVRAEAARLLGISRYQLLRRLEKFGISSGGDR
jgi:DNA-binding NtrC family response regulator